MLFEFSAAKRRLAVATALMTLVLLLCAASAVAATRFAAPGATGPSPCVKTNPCSIATAAAGAAAADEVVLEPGEYSDTVGDLGPAGSVVLPEGIGFHGAAGPRPVVRVDTNHGLAAPLIVQAGDVVSHIEIDSSAARSSISLKGGEATDLIARTSAPGGPRATSNVGSCATPPASSSAQLGTALGATGAPAASTVTLRNVTAVATGTDSTGIGYVLVGASAVSHPEVRVDGVAVISRGARNDILAEALSVAPHTPGTGAKVDIHLDHSDYATISTRTDAGGGSTSVNASGAGTTNLEAAPQLAADGYHELATSPTVDAGATDNLSPKLDVDGQTRTIERPDIGADELAHQTETTLQCVPNTVAGQASTCTVTVKDTHVPPILLDRGKVDFASDGQGAFSATSCDLVTAAGQTTCDVTYTPARGGVQQITAAYRGDGSHEKSEATAVMRLLDPTTTALTCAPDGVTLGTTTRCTVTVANSLATGLAVPTGTVEFESDSEGAFSLRPASSPPPRTEPPARSATPLPRSTRRVHKLTATYRPDPIHLGSKRLFPIEVGAVRFAAPGGRGPQSCENPSNPCSLQQAATPLSGALKPGDVVSLAPGKYSDTAGDFGRGFTLTAGHGVAVRGAPGSPRPTIEVKEGSGPVVALSGGSASHLEIAGTSADTGIQLSGGVAEDLVVRTSRAGAISCSQIDGLLRDSACLSSGQGAAAVGSEPSSAEAARSGHPSSAT